MFTACIAILLQLAPFSVLSAATEPSSPSETRLGATAAELQTRFAYARDPERKLGFDAVRGSDYRGFTPVASPTALSFGLTDDIVWLRVEVQTATPGTTYLLELDNPLLDRVDAYVPEPDGTFRFFRSGDNLPFSAREIKHRSYVFPFTLVSNETSTIYIRVDSKSAMLLPLKVKAFETFMKASGDEKLIFGIYYGAIAVMVLYNLLLFLALRERAFFFYVLFIAGLCSFQLADDGTAFEYLWPTSPWWNNKAPIFFSSFTAVCGLYFVKHFLAAHSSRLRWAFHIIAFIAAMPGLLILFITGSHFVIRLAYIGPLLVTTLSIGAGYSEVRAGNVAASYLMLALYTMTFAILIFVGNGLGVIPSSLITEYGVQIGTVLMVVLFSFALAHRYHRLEAEKEIVREELVQTRIKGLETKQQAEASTQKAVKLKTRLMQAQRLETAGKIAGQIAHDFNNLLGPLTGYPTLIKDELPEGSMAGSLLDEIERAALKIAAINQQLLSLGRLGHYATGPVNLNRLITDTISELNVPEDITLVTELTKDLCYIRGGEQQLSRVLINLVTNAIEAMSEKGVVTIRTRNLYLDKPLRTYDFIQPGEYVRLDVEDTGRGIPESSRSKLFDPLFTTKELENRRGSGLGLSVVKGVTKDHSGYVTVESVQGKGSMFSLYFPITREADTMVEETMVKKFRGNERILLVEDDRSQRRVITLILMRLGYEVHSVDSGEKAIDLIAKHPQNLLILDMVMNGLDGTETYRRILEINPDQKALIVSGYARSRQVQEALRLGAGGFLTKPVTPQNLAAEVRRELDRVRESKQSPL